MLTSATVAQALHASLTLASGFFPYCAIGFSYGAGTSQNRRRMMLVGVPREIKDSEYRVGLVPSTVHELTLKGHRVLVEKDAGVGAGLTDDAYVAAGAEIAASADQVFAEAELIVKVKEPLAPERKKLRSGQVLFTYLHLAPDRTQTQDLMASGCIAIAYETVTSPQGGLPLLMPMSEVAGRMAPQAGAHCLEKAIGGRGVLLGGVPGVPADDVVHYCVANMPGAVARTSTFALNNMTLPHVIAHAERGYRVALGQDPHLRAGLNVHEGRITYKAVADALKLPYVPAEQALRM